MSSSNNAVLNTSQNNSEIINLLKKKLEQKQRSLPTFQVTFSGLTSVETVAGPPEPQNFASNVTFHPYSFTPNEKIVKRSVAEAVSGISAPVSIDNGVSVIVSPSSSQTADFHPENISSSKSPSQTGQSFIHHKKGLLKEFTDQEYSKEEELHLYKLWAEQEMAAMRFQIQNQLEKIKIAEAEFQNVSARISDERMKNHFLTQQNNVLLYDKEILSKKLEQTESLASLRTQELTDERERVENKIGEVTKAFENMQRNNIHIQLLFRQKCIDFSKLLSAYNTLEQNFNTQEQTKDAINQKYENLMQTNAKLQDSVDKLIRNQGDLATSKAKLEQRIVSLNSDAEVAKQAKENSEQSLANLKRQISEEKKVEQIMQCDLSALQSDCQKEEIAGLHQHNIVDDQQRLQKTPTLFNFRLSSSGVKRKQGEQESRNNVECKKQKTVITFGSTTKMNSRAAAPIDNVELITLSDSEDLEDAKEDFTTWFIDDLFSSISSEEDSTSQRK